MELLLVLAFLWLLMKAAGLAFQMAWGMAKIAASILLALAVPALILCLLFAGGILLLVPVAMIGAALGLLKRCV